MEPAQSSVTPTTSVTPVIPSASVTPVTPVTPATPSRPEPKPDWMHHGFVQRHASSAEPSLFPVWESLGWTEVCYPAPMLCPFV